MCKVKPLNVILKHLPAFIPMSRRPIMRSSNNPVEWLRPIIRAAANANVLLTNSVPFLAKTYYNGKYLMQKTKLEWRILPVCISSSIPPQLHRQWPTNQRAYETSEGEYGHNSGPKQGENILWYVNLVTLPPGCVDEILHILQIKEEKTQKVMFWNMSTKVSTHIIRCSIYHCLIKHLLH